MNIVCENYLFLFLYRNKPIHKRIGKHTANKMPDFKFPPKNPEIVPTSVGPLAQPRSPAKANSANIAVLPGSVLAARLNVPGQNRPTDNPHRPHPISESAGIGESEAIR